LEAAGYRVLERILLPIFKYIYNDKEVKALGGPAV